MCTLPLLTVAPALAPPPPPRPRSPPRPAALVSSWARAEGDSKLGAALAELQKLHLLAQVVRGGQEAWAINASFQAQLRHAVCSGCEQS